MLAHGYLLNHTALSVHRLQGLEEGGGIGQLAALLQGRLGAQLNADGGVVKASADGGLLQLSTLADAVACSFAAGDQGPLHRSIAGPYLEFAERRPQPRFAGLPAAELQEWQRRDGFEAGNADKIFTSTRLQQ